MTNYEDPTLSATADEEHAWDAWPTLFEHVIGLQDIDVDPVDGFDQQSPVLVGLCAAQSTIKVFHNEDGNNTGETFDTLSKADRIAAWAGSTVAGATSSGLHHARYDRGAGYCTLNGLVVAAKAVLAAGARRVLVVDLDAHCGGGTASLIEGVDGIEQVDVSVVSYDSYESRPDAQLEVVGADGYLDAVRRALAEVVDPGSVDLVIYNAGMDPHEWAGGVSGITTSVMRQRDRMVMEWAETHDLPVAFVMAGGYQGGTWDLDDVAALHGVTFDEALRSLDRRAAA